MKCITCGICTKYHENTITYTNTTHSTWIFHRFCCPSYFRGEDHVAVYRTEKAFSSNARPLSVSSHDLCREIKMYWARRPITKDLFGKQSLAFGLGIAIGSFPQIISPKHSHKSPISNHFEESLVIVTSACQHLFFILMLLLLFLPSNSSTQFKPSV